MEAVNLIVTGTGPSDQEEICYSSSLKVPPRSQLLELVPCHLDKLLSEVKFHTGPLAGVNHKIVICLYRECNDPVLSVFTSVERHQKDEVIVDLKMITSTWVLSDGSQLGFGCSLVRACPPKNLRRDDPALGKWYEGDERWRNDFWKLEERWHEDASMIVLLFHVAKRNPPKIIYEDEEPFRTSMEAGREKEGLIQVRDFFMNEYLSDFKILCGEVEFPAHRLVLSARVSYFEKMFTSSMKESQEGLLHLKDIDPRTCKELLRFIYQGRVENLKEHVMELFATSDKYGMDDLKAICEHHLYKSLGVENALEIYDLSRTHQSEVLAKRAKEIILRNRGRFAPDPETFKNFTCKYPDLVFQLFTMS